MLNNPALDTAIGLIFIFLLYSLLATTIKEFIATLFAYRGRMLERGIEQMLDGKNYSYYWWDKVMNYFIWLLNYIRVWLHNRRIAAQNKLKGMLEGNTEPPVEPYKLSEFVYSRKMDTSKAPAQKKIPRRVLNDKAKLFAANITSHDLFKRSAENSLFYKKPAYLSANNFTDILVDILADKGDAATPVTMDDIKKYVEEKLEQNPGLKRILNIYIEKANGDIQQFRTLVQKWYDDTMDRVSGWYKKQANKILFMIGIVLAIIFNVSTIDISKKLYTDKPVRDAMIKNASAFIEKAAADSTKRDSANTAALNNSPRTDSAVFANTKQKLNEIKQLYQGSLEQENTIMGLGWGDYGYTEDSLAYAKQLATPLPGKNPGKPVRPGSWAKVWYILGETFSNFHLLLGFILTAFAISLGAPFWFDLLNKVINLRGTGKKPADLPAAGDSQPAAKVIVKVEKDNSDDAIG